MKRFAALLLSMAMALSILPASLAAQTSAKVTGNCVRVHAKADIDSESYDQVNKGDVLEVVEQEDENGWVKVRFTYSGTGEEKEGYVSADYLKLTKARSDEESDEKKSKDKEKAEDGKKADGKRASKPDSQQAESSVAAESSEAAESQSEEKDEGKRAPTMIADTDGDVSGYVKQKEQEKQKKAQRASTSAAESSADTSQSVQEADASESAPAAQETDASESTPAAQETDPADASASAAEESAASASAAGESEQQAPAAPLPEEDDDEISPKVSYTATVNDEGINLRKEPSLEAEVLTQVPEGDIVIIRSEEDEDGWMKVLYYDSEGTKFKGYMMGEYLDINSIGVGRSNVPSVIIREQPDTESVICGVVPKDKKVDVFVNRDGWYRIEYKDLSGWVQADCITVEGESDCEGYCRVTQESLNLREAPDLESGKLEKIPEGIILQVTDKTEDGKWYVVSFNGHTGYVSTEYVEDVDGCSEGYVQTTASSLSLRTGAGSSFARLTTIPQGQVLPVSGTVGDWYEVKYGKFTGYVSGSFVSATTKDGFRAYPDYVEIKSDDVAVRAEPSEDSEQLETLEKGTLLAIQGIRDGWYQVTYNGETGYVNGEQAERGTEAANQAAEQAAAAIEAGGEAMTQSNGGGGSILEYASQFIGNPYVWGGTSLTNGADCSGFVKSILAHFGIDVPHSSAAIRGCGRSVSESEMQPGDIVCYSGHVGIYAGNGRLLSALGKRYGITYNSVHYKQILSVRRFT